MTNKIRLGLIGVGKWGMNYVKTIENIEEAELKIIACKNIQNKPYLANNYKVIDNWHEITQSKEIDGIIIATPPKTHFEIATEAINNRKPIVIEKPLTLNLKNANSILSVALEKQVSVKVNHIYLYHPSYRFLKSLIRDKFNFNSIYSLAGNWGPFRNDVSPLWDWAPHDLAMCLDLMQEIPLEIDAKLTKEIFDPNKNMFNICINLRFRNNKYAELNFGNIIESKKRVFKINYDNKSYLFDPFNFRFIQQEINFQLTEIKPIKSINSCGFFDSPLKVLIYDFIKVIKKSKFDIYDLKLGKEVIKLIEIAESKLDKK